MTDYRYVMGLLVSGLAYRQIEAMAGCSHRAIARARRVLDDEELSSAEQVAAQERGRGVRAGGYRQGRHGTAGS
jgi:cobalamin-dependent methionine synthase I